MSRDIFLRLLFSLFIFLLIFALHRLITVSPRPALPALSQEQPWLGVRGGILAPSHTLPAFSAAVAAGADLLIFSVQPSADGEVILFAGDTLEQATDGSGRVGKQTLAALKQLDAGYRFSADGGLTFPYRGQGLRLLTLGELSAAFPTATLLIDLEEESPQMVAALVGAIAQAGAADRVIIANANADTLRQLRGRFPQIAAAAGPRERNFLLLFARLHLDRFHRPLSDLYLLPAQSGFLAISDARIIAAAHQFNQKVLYQVDDPAEMQRLLQIGADGIVTNRPDLAAEVF